MVWLIFIGHLYSSITSHITATLCKTLCPASYIRTNFHAGQTDSSLGGLYYLQCASVWMKFPVRNPKCDCMWVDLDKGFALHSSWGSQACGPSERTPLGQSHKGATQALCIKGLIPNSYACCCLGLGKFLKTTLLFSLSFIAPAYLNLNWESPYAKEKAP